MSGLHPLSTDRHRSRYIDAMAGAAARRLFQIGLSEIPYVAADMPICFTKDAATGRFGLIALTGLIAADNLFVSNGGYRGTYLPRAASLTAFRLDPAGVGGLAVDEGDLAFAADGQPLFVDGSPGTVVREARDALDHIVRDVGDARELADAYASRKLLRPLKIALKCEDETQHVIDGLYAVDETGLAELDDAAVVAMHRADQLAPAAIFAASLAQLERLRQLHNAAHDTKIISFALSLAPGSKPR